MLVRPRRDRDDRPVRHWGSRLQPPVRDDGRLPRAHTGRSSLLIGHALKEIVPILVQALLIGLAMLAVFSVGLGSLSYALALATRDREWLLWGWMAAGVLAALGLAVGIRGMQHSS